MSKIPSSKRATEHAQELGPDAWAEYRDLRERYKGEGLTPKEAYQRAYVELKVYERWLDQKQRRSAQRAVKSQVALTPDEAAAAGVGYQRPVAAKVESIGDQDMVVAEQVKWAMRWAARVQSGEDPPRRFPCEGALFWYQSAVGNRREFEKLLLRVEAPGGDPDNLYLQDSQMQFSEIEKQLKQVLEEVKGRFREVEAEFLDELGEAAQARD